MEKEIYTREDIYGYVIRMLSNKKKREREGDELLSGGKGIE